MSMSSAMSAGVSGLAANSTRLATISDNIANSGTYGYKRMETDFNSFVLNQHRIAGMYSAGGVTATTNRVIEDDGALSTTSHPLDIAVSGRGMLPVTSAVDLDNGFTNLPFMMTRTGSFRTDAEGVLKTQSGLVLMGWPAQSDGSIPVMSRDTMTGLVPVRISLEGGIFRKPGHVRGFEHQLCPRHVGCDGYVQHLGDGGARFSLGSRIEPGGVVSHHL